MSAVSDLRMPPANCEAEQNVLGALMLAPEGYAKVADWLTEDDFYRHDHRLIFRGIVGLLDSGSPVDPVTMGEWFESEGLAEQIGGTGYVIQLGSTQGSAANLVAYAEIVAEKARLRRLVEIGTRLAGGAFEPGRASADLVANATHELSGMQAARRGGLAALKPAMNEWWEALQARYASGNRMTGLPTPWLAVNDLTFGLQPGNLIVVGGRPAMGKSIIGFNLASFTALRGKRTGLFSLEMTRDEVVQRCVSALKSIPHDWLRSPATDKDSERWSDVSAAVSTMVNAPLLIDDQSALTIEQICARARRAHQQSPLSLLIVDHMHIVRLAGKDTVRELGAVSGALKALAKDLAIPVVALAQLNRGNTARADRRPTMADLRASGEIEQDADLVILLHREDYYEKDVKRHTGAVELIVGKARNAPTTTLYLQNEFQFMRADDWIGEPPRARPQAKQQQSGGFE